VLRHVKTTSQDPALLVGLDAPDDAAVYLVAPGLAIVQTVDFFTPIVDDPAAWGRIAAANAFSDIYAMGADPKTALNLVAWPRSLDFEILGRVLDGAGQACEEAGVSIVGGHSIDDPEPKFGLAVTGFVDPDAIVRKSGAQTGNDLILTKPLGMGIISSGIKEGLTSEGTANEAMRVMGTLNRPAAEVMARSPVTAGTDVTGFGLVGHLLQMLDGSLSAEVEFEAVPVLQEAFDLAAKGVLPGGSKRNIEAMSGSVEDEAGLDDAQRAVLFDAQTSGGLLMAVNEGSTDSVIADLKAAGVAGASVIGRFVEGAGIIKII
jgi:selenide, water dikinase